MCRAAAHGGLPPLRCARPGQKSWIWPCCLGQPVQPARAVCRVAGPRGRRSPSCRGESAGKRLCPSPMSPGISQLPAPLPMGLSCSDCMLHPPPPAPQAGLHPSVCSQSALDPALLFCILKRGHSPPSSPLPWCSPKLGASCPGIAPLDGLGKRGIKSQFQPSQSLQFHGRTMSDCPHLGAAPAPSPSRHGRKRHQAPAPSLPCQARSTSALPAAGGLFYSQQRCWESRMSRTPPWVFWHRFGLLPTLGNQNPHSGRVGPASAPLLSAAEGTRGERRRWGSAVGLGARGARGVLRGCPARSAPHPSVMPSGRAGGWG